MIKEFAEIIESEEVEREVVVEFRKTYCNDVYTHDTEGDFGEGFNEDEIYKMVYYSEYNSYERLAKLFDTDEETIRTIFDYGKFYELDEEPTITQVRKQIVQAVGEMMSDHFSFSEIQDYFGLSYQELGRIEGRFFEF